MPVAAAFDHSPRLRAGRAILKPPNCLHRRKIRARTPNSEFSDLCPISDCPPVKMVWRFVSRLAWSPNGRQDKQDLQDGFCLPAGAIHSFQLNPAHPVHPVEKSGLNGIIRIVAASRGPPRTHNVLIGRPGSFLRSRAAIRVCCDAIGSNRTVILSTHAP